MQVSATTLEKNMEASSKPKHRSAYDPAILFLGLYTKECDTSYSKGTCTPMFIAALFTLAKLWKQPICPTTDK
jgi:hypothetical protein